MKFYAVYIIIFMLCFVSCSKKEQAPSSSDKKIATASQVVSHTASSKSSKASRNLPQVPLKKHHEEKSMMGTYMVIDVCYTEDQGARLADTMPKVWAHAQDVALRMSKYEKDSDISRINQSYNETIPVEADVYGLIQKAKDYHALTQGTFDITIGPLVDMWKDFAKHDTFPLHRDITQAKQSVGIDHIQLLANNQVQVKQPGVKIDLGGIAKGYVIDETAGLLKQRGFNQFLIDAGGDVFVGGVNCSYEPWQIGIRHPKQTDKLYDVALVSDQAVTTSGNYEQFFRIQGKNYSHIINPITGYPQKGISSVSIVAPSAIEADVLATAVSVLGTEKGLELIEQLGEQYAVLVLEENGNAVKRHANSLYESLRQK